MRFLGDSGLLVADAGIQSPAGDDHYFPPSQARASRLLERPRAASAPRLAMRERAPSADEEHRGGKARIKGLINTVSRILHPAERSPFCDPEQVSPSRSGPLGPLLGTIDEASSSSRTFKAEGTIAPRWSPDSPSTPATPATHSRLGTSNRPRRRTASVDMSADAQLPTPQRKRAAHPSPFPGPWAASRGGAGSGALASPPHTEAGGGADGGERQRGMRQRWKSLSARSWGDHHMGGAGPASPSPRPPAAEAPGGVLDHIPNECLVNIFTWLHGRDRHSARLTCRKWNSLAASATTAVDVRRLPRSNRELAAFLAPRAGGLRAVTLQSTAKLSASGLLCVARACASLTDVDLSYQGNVSDAVLEALAGGCPRLRSVNLKVFCGRITARGLGVLADKCRGLERLALPARVSDETVREAAPRLRALRRLDLSWCSKLTDATAHVLARDQTRLTELDASHTQISDAGLDVISSNLRQLRWLRLSGVHSASPRGLAGFVASLSQLQTLDLGKNSNMVEWLDALARVTCPSMRALNINFEATQQIGLHSLSMLARGCPALEHLNLGCYSRISPRDGTVIASQFGSLHTLALPCFGVTDLVVHELAAACPALRSLRIGMGSEARYELAHSLLVQMGGNQVDCLVTDMGLEVLGGACPRLQDLHMYSRHVAGHAFAAWPTDMLELSLSGTAVQDSGLAAVAAGCPKVKKLSLRQCHQFTICGIKEVVSGCSKLEQLDLRGCVQLPPGPLAEIIGSAPRLQFIKPPKDYHFFRGFEKIVSARGCQVKVDMCQ